MRLLREPLIHFLLLGSALFAIFRLMGEFAGEGQIKVSTAQIDQLIKGYKLDFKRAPTPEEVDKLIDEYIREEVLCRTAWDQKLDRDDQTVRRRLRQKMEFFNEDRAEIGMPTDEQLAEFLQKNPAMFRGADGKVPELAEIRDSVQNAWIADAKRQAAQSEYLRLKSRYHVVIDPRPQPAASTSEAR